MKTLLLFLPTLLMSATIQPGQTMYFTSPIELTEQRYRLTLWSPDPFVSLTMTSTDPLIVTTGSGWRTTGIGDDRIRDFVYLISGTSGYTTGTVPAIGVTNGGDTPWTWDQSSLNIRSLDGSNYGVVPMTLSSDTVPTPEPATFLCTALALGILHRSRRASMSPVWSRWRW